MLLSSNVRSLDKAIAKARDNFWSRPERKKKERNKNNPSDLDEGSLKANSVVKLSTGFEPVISSLPRRCFTPKPRERIRLIII